MNSDPPQLESRPQEAAAEQGGPIRRIARNGAISLFASVVQTVVMLLVLGIFARTLGPTSLGLYFSVLVIAVMVQLVLEAGMATIITLRISQSPQQWKQTVAEAAGILLVVLVGCLVLPLLLGWGWSLWQGRPLLFTLGLAAALTCVGMQIQQFGFGVFRAFERFEFEGLSKVVQATVLLLLAGVLATRSQIDVQTAVFCLAASHLVGAGLVLVVMAWKWPITGPVISRNILKSWFSQAVPLGIGTILRRCTLQIDHLLLALLQPPAMLGLYNVALRPLGPLNLVPQAMVSASFPFLAKSSAGDRDALHRAFAASVRYLVIIAIPITAALWLLAEPMVLLLAGEEFLDAAAPLRVLATILIFSYPSAQFRFVLTAIGRQSVYTWLVFATLLFQVVLEAVLIIRLGYMGACYGFLVGEAVFFGIGIVACRRLGLGSVSWSCMAKVLPAATLLGLGLWMCRSTNLPTQLVAVAVGTLLFFGLSVLLGAISAEEFRNIRGLARGRRRQVRVSNIAECESFSTATRS